ncbi:MAG: DUF1731 domain-containing protein, partial [Cyclobacteriaceae bacterium]
VLGDAVNACKNPPKVWINAASATIYPHSLSQPMTEDFTEFDNDFSVDVCKKWEASFNRFQVPGVRKILLRIAIVLGKEYGAFIPLKMLTRLGLGGRQGTGNQMFSWLHEKDMAGIVDFCLQNENISGVYNVSAPDPVTNRKLMKTLRQQVKTVIGLPMPKWLLEIGAFIIGTETELILKSRYVIPERLLDAGYQFRYDTIEKAVSELCE